MRIAVVTAGLSTPSSSRLLAEDLARVLRERHGAEIELIELRPLAHQLVDNVLTGFPAADLRAALDAVARADGLVAVSPIFSASYSGLFKMFFDVLDQGALAGMPVLIGATGGTERHSLALEHALRPLFAYFGAQIVPTAVFAASADFGAPDGDSAGLGARVQRAAGELAVLATALGPRTVADPFSDVVDLEQLIAGR